MNGDPFDPQVGFLALALEEAVVLVDDEGLDRTVAALIVEIYSSTDQDRIVGAWDRAMAALARVEEVCLGGPLLALIFNDMNDVGHANRGPLDLCLALALMQALPLLPTSAGFAEAVDVLVEGAEAWPPSSLDDTHLDGVVVSKPDMEVAHRFVIKKLHDMIDRSIGGALAVLLLRWLHNRPVG